MEGSPDEILPQHDSKQRLEETKPNDSGTKLSESKISESDHKRSSCYSESENVENDAQSKTSNWSIRQLEDTGRKHTSFSRASTAIAVSEKPPYFNKFRVRRAFKWTTPADGSQWGVHWYKPGTMIFLALCGLFTSLGHHLYNTNLHGTKVRDPEWPQRWGVALAFFIKMVLVDAVKFAYTQNAWVVVRRRAFKVRTLNGLFSVCNDPWQFLSKELLLHAIVPALLAGLTWILPLCAIATPSSLTSQTGLESVPKGCTVPSLDFNRDNGYDIEAAGDHGKTILSLWETLDNGTHYYVGPTRDLDRMFTLSILSDSPVQPGNPCPGNGNCTYSISFEAPSYECEEKPEWPAEAPWTRDQFGSSGKLIYGSWSSGSEDDLGIPTAWENFSLSDDGMGVFMEIPTLWVGWVTNSSKPLDPAEGNTTLWKHHAEGHVMECVLHNSTYHLTLDWVQGEMIVRNSTIQPIRPLLGDGEKMAPWQPTYQQFAGYHAAGLLFRQFISGNITQEAMGAEENYATYPHQNSKIITTDLMVPRTQFPVHEDRFIEGIESHFHNLFLALTSDHVLQISVINVTVPCTVTSTVLLWSYSPFWLALSYLLAVSLTFVAVGVGLYAYYTNGVAMESEFSTFLSTTRNADIDEIVKGSSLGAWPARDELLNERLKFGLLTKAEDRAGDLQPVGFGLAGSVKTVNFGDRVF